VQEGDHGFLASSAGGPRVRKGGGGHINRFKVTLVRTNASAPSDNHDRGRSRSREEETTVGEAGRIESIEEQLAYTGPVESRVGRIRLRRETKWRREGIRSRGNDRSASKERRKINGRPKRTWKGECQGEKWRTSECGLNIKGRIVGTEV